MKSRSLLMVNLVLLGVVFGFGLFFFTQRDGNLERVYAEDRIITPQEVATLESIQESFRLISERVIPSVVELQVVEYVEVPSFNFFNFNFGNDDEEALQPVEGLGSGVIIRRDGNKYYVLTNDHVAGSAETITVVMHDQTTYEGSLVGTNGDRDLALVSFESNEELPIAPLGDSDNLYVGDWVLAIGSPFGYVSTVTSGIVSALDRSGDEIQNLNNFIQTDAAINQGNSGGPLVNIYGEVIGINTWIASTSGSSAGLGFAIPINNAKKLIDDFIDYGRIVEGWIGITMASDEYSDRIFKDIGYEGNGTFVSAVYSEASSLAEALRPGDIITEINGVLVETASDISKTVQFLSPSDRVKLVVIRDGKTLEVSGRLKERPESTAELEHPWPYGVVLPLDEDIRESLEIPSSVEGVVLSLYNNSPLATAGLQHLDVITKINDTPIKSVADFYRVMNQDIEEFSMYYYRNGFRGFIGVIK